MAIEFCGLRGVVAATADPHFRDLMEMEWETGARARELRKIEASGREPPNRRTGFAPKQAKGKKRYRVIYLAERAREIMHRLSIIDERWESGQTDTYHASPTARGLAVHDYPGHPASPLRGPRLAHIGRKRLANCWKRGSVESKGNIHA
jgi:hypothetical protein